MSAIVEGEQKAARQAELRAQLAAAAALPNDLSHLPPPSDSPKTFHIPRKPKLAPPAAHSAAGAATSGAVAVADTHTRIVQERMHAVRLARLAHAM